MFGLCFCQTDKDTLEDYGFAINERQSFKNSTTIAESGKKYNLLFRNNPYKISNEDSIEVYFNNYLVCKSNFKELHQVKIPENLIDKYVMTAIFIKQNNVEYWFLKQDRDFKILNSLDESENVINIVFTPENFDHQPYLFFCGRVL